MPRHLGIVADYVHPSIIKVCSSTCGCFQEDNAGCHNTQIISDWLLSTTLSSLYSSTVTTAQSNRAPLGCGRTGDSHHGYEVDSFAATVWCYHLNVDQKCQRNPFSTLLNLYHEELRQFRGLSRPVTWLTWCPFRPLTWTALFYRAIHLWNRKRS